MNTIQWLVLYIALAGMPVSIGLFRRSARVSWATPDDGRARFESGWLGYFGFLIGMASCFAVLVVAAPFMRVSWLAFGGTILVNFVVQPFALLFFWIGVRKFWMGTTGSIAVAWRRVSDDELKGIPENDRGQLAWYCVAQGVVALPIGIAISCVAASPILDWAFG